MVITEIRGFHLSFPLAEPMGNSLNLFRKRDAFLVQLVTDAGLSGWGEAGNSPHAAAAFIRNRLAPTVLGRAPQEFGRHYQAMMTLLGYDRRGAAMMAVSALDIALHDLAARCYGVSVATLLGGALRDSMFAYASGPFLRAGPDPYRAYAAEVDGYLARGFRAIKPRGGADPKADGAMARMLRRQIGPDTALIVDINQGYTAAAAIRSAQEMAEADLLWIEEPVQPEDLPGYQAFGRAVGVAVAGGEAMAGVRAFRDFAAAQALSILQPDLSICGGFSTLRQIAAIGTAYDLPVMPHVFGTAVNYHASLQMAATLEPKRGGGPAAYPFIEIDMMDNPLLALGGPLTLLPDGSVAVPDGPGIGLSLEPEQLAPWLTDHWSVTV